MLFEPGVLALGQAAVVYGAGDCKILHQESVFFSQL